MVAALQTAVAIRMFIFQPKSFDRLAFTDGDPDLRSMSLRASPESARLPVRGIGAIAKRAEDIVVALIALFIMSPLLVLAAILIRATSPGPVLFRQERVGLDGRRFVMLKFRTMRFGEEEPAQWRQATRGDKRVTWIGGILRRTSFDEVPQFFNVLIGDMSVVGPRPHAPGTCAGGRPFEHVTHRYAARHCVKPGMTGLAQVRGWRGETDTEEKFLRRLDSDLEYIAHWSLTSDLLILCRTILTVACMQNAY